MDFGNICRFTLLFAAIAAIRTPWEMLAAVLTVVFGVVFYFFATKKKSEVQ